MNVTKDEFLDKMETCKEKQSKEIGKLSDKIFSKLDDIHISINKIDKESALSTNDITALQDISKKIVPRWAFTWTVLILVGVASGFGTYSITRVEKNSDHIAELQVDIGRIENIENEISDVNKFFKNYILTVE